jgi:hypothetical protein
MRRALVGTLFVLHGLAHAGAGMWAADRAPVWVITPLWGVAMVGFVAAGFGLLGVPLLRRRWEQIAAIAAVSSVMLLGLFGTLQLMLGLAIDVAVLVAGLRWGEVVTLGGVQRPHRRVLARLGYAAAGTFILYLTTVVALRPWHMRWGTTADERMMALPGDNLVPDAHYRMDHAVTIHAPAAEVWMWLVQIGQDRGGFYSYDKLERMVGARVHNTDRIVPEWQQRAQGDLVRAVPPDWMGGRFGREIGWRVAEIEPGRALVLENWGAFVVRPIDERTSRLHIRLRGEGTPTLAGAALAPLGLLGFEPAHFIMERGMLLGIKERAEAVAY